MTSEACNTGASIASNSISTSTIHAWVWQTVVDIELTIGSIESGQACTIIPVGEVIACGTILARIGRTLVYICLTVDTSEACITTAHVCINQVRTITVVGAVVAVSALIDVYLTACSIEARKAVARIIGNTVDTCTILASVVKALIDVDVTIGSIEASIASTVESSIEVVACTINTGVQSDSSCTVGGTLINIDITVGSIPSSSAGTVIGANIVVANAAIFAWIRLTLVDWILTTITSPAVSTGTVEISNIQLGTVGTVET